MLLLLLFVTAQVFDFQKFNQRKDESFKSGRIAEFIAYAQALENQHRQETEIRFGLAEAYLRVDDFAAARRTLVEVIKLRPEAPVFQRSAALLESFGRLDELIELYQEWRRQLGSRTAHAFEVASLYNRVQNFRSGALELLNWLRFDTLTAKSADFTTAAERIVQFYKKDRKVAQLVGGAALDRKIKGQLLARIYLADDKYEAALHEYLSLKDERLIESFARLCQSKGLDSLALVCYNRLGLDVDAARILMARHDFHNAFRRLEHEKSTAGRILYAECLMRLAKLDEAERIVASLPSESWSLSAHLVMARLRLRRGDLDGSNEVLVRAAGIVPRESLPFVFWERANVCLYRHNVEDAVSGYNWLVNRFPASPLANDALERLFLIRRAGGDSTALASYARILYLAATDAGGDAIDTARVFIGRYPSLAEYGYDLIADLHCAGQSYDKALAAIEEYDQAYPRGEKRAAMLLGKARILLTTGEKTRAKAVLEMIVLGFGSAPEVAVARELLGELR